MKFCIIISCAPSSSLSLTALKFCEALVKLNHTISAIYFLGDGVYHALKLSNTEDIFFNTWHNLMMNNKIKLFNCSSAHIKRGIDIEATKINIAGLGELISAMKNSQRVIKF